MCLLCKSIGAGLELLLAEWVVLVETPRGRVLEGAVSKDDEAALSLTAPAKN